MIQAIFQKSEIKLKDALPQETWDRADQIVATYDDWYNNTATLSQKLIALGADIKRVPGGTS